MKTVTLDQAAALVNGEASVRPGPTVTGARPLEFAERSDITYVMNAKFLRQLDDSRAGAVLVPRSMDPPAIPHIVVDNPEAAFARLTAEFYPYPEVRPGISRNADVHPTAELGSGVEIGPFAVIGKGCCIGDDTVISAHTAVGDDVRIGSGTRIFPNVTIYHGVTIGDRVIIHSGTVIGSDGFGFAGGLDEQGRPFTVKKYHSGTVVIGDDVEIGALCAIDRALAGSTKLGDRVKLDNLVQVAHNVTIGEGTVIAAQSGMAGSSSVGGFCILGGQVGLRDHVHVGNGVTLATRVGVYRDVPDGQTMGGSIPAMPYNVFLRAQGLFKRLPEMLERIRKLERSLLVSDKDSK